ncbi:MAG: SpoIIE family protein phosphatase, partial [Actinomycetota bacterium]|nr:SpoIIE family protein phosphatase [Actinomycetota bacterium]
QSLGAIFWEADAETFEFAFVSQRAEDLLGYPLERWLLPGFWASIIHPDDRDAAVAALVEATAQVRDGEFEYRALTADGRLVWLKDIVSVIPDDTGKAQTLRGVMVDITDQKQVERTLEESKDRYAHLARVLQSSLLPPDLPSIAGFEVAARYRPAGEGNEVGGDFYDVFSLEGGDHALVMGDVCGKGPRAAALTGVARHTTRAASAYESSPSSVLTVLNEAIREQSEETQFATVVYGRLRRRGSDATLMLAAGGHPLPFLLRAGEVEEIGRSGTLLGVIEDPDLFDEEVMLEPGDTVVFYTDGVIDARGPHIDEAWLKRVLQNHEGKTADEIAEAVARATIERLPGEPRDDIAVLVLRRPA